jgi:hypothetical protein
MGEWMIVKVEWMIVKVEWMSERMESFSSQSWVSNQSRCMNQVFTARLRPEPELTEWYHLKREKAWD